MSRVQLSFACGDYDRTRAIAEGTVRADGIEINYLRLPVEETFFRMLRHREFDVAEMSLSSYVVSLREDPPPFVALPAYTSRSFRHSSVYVSASAGIDRPRDLVGKRVGCPEYQLTAIVWVRGIMAQLHGVPIDSVVYVTGGQETPGRIEKAALDLPANIRVERIGGDQTLSQMLADGEIDALYTPRIPGPFAAGDKRILRLFPDVVAAEKEYFNDTGIFPIMHVVVIRREIYERHRWVAQSLYKALLESKARAIESLYDSSALRFMLPWLNQHLEEARSLLGDDFWSYGLEPNRGVLDTFLAYHHEQGLSARRLTPDELFARETAEGFVI